MPEYKPRQPSRRRTAETARAMEVPCNCWPGCANACILVLIVSTGYMAVCSAMPAVAPASMCLRNAALCIGGGPSCESCPAGGRSAGCEASGGDAGGGEAAGASCIYHRDQAAALVADVPIDRIALDWRRAIAAVPTLACRESPVEQRAVVSGGEGSLLSNGTYASSGNTFFFIGAGSAECGMEGHGWMQMQSKHSTHA